MEYSNIDKEHAQLLEKMTAMCRSNKERFVVDDRLHVIREELQGTDYTETFDDRLFSMWSKIPLEELPDDVILVSSHADIVPSIKECTSVLGEDGFYQGTYDNIGTNAAMLLTMKEFDMPSNVVFAFTGDEETGGCTGAKQAAELLTSYGKKLTCIALDVTYEGFWENRLCSIENCRYVNENEQEFLKNVASAALSGENMQSFCFVKAGASYIPENLDAKYLTPSVGMYDEAYAYRYAGYPSLSFCLPCNGNMHALPGVKVKQPVFEGYVISLASFLYELTKTHPQIVELHKIAKDNLIQAAASIQYERPVYKGFSGYFHNYDEDYDDDYDDEEEEEYEYEEDEYDDYNDEDEELLPWSELATDETEEEIFDKLTEKLWQLAYQYDPTEEKEFVDSIDIPYDLMYLFCADPDGAILPEEEDAMKEFLSSIFRNAHSYHFSKDKTCDTTEEYFERWKKELSDEGYHENGSDYFDDY